MCCESESITKTALNEITRNKAAIATDRVMFADRSLLELTDCNRSTLNIDSEQSRRALYDSRMQGLARDCENAETTLWQMEGKEGTQLCLLNRFGMAGGYSW